MKIFRKQRSENLPGNRFVKYLLYALGEVVLVVIGILIAVNVNNWNAQRKSEKQALSLLEDLRLDLRRDTMTMGKRIQYVERMIESKKRYLMLDNYDNQPTLNLEFLTYSMGHSIEINKSSYQRIQKSTAWNLMNYQELYKEVSTYYILVDDAMKFPREWDSHIHLKEFEFWSMHAEVENIHLYVDSVPIQQSEEERRAKYLEVLHSVKGRNMLKLSIYRDGMMLQQYKAGYEAAVRTLKSLEKHLPKERLAKEDEELFVGIESEQVE